MPLQLGHWTNGEATLLACHIPMMEHMALNHPPANSDPRSLQMVRGVQKTASLW